MFVECNKWNLLTQQVEKGNVTGGKLNQQVENSSATSGNLLINKWVGKVQQV